MKKLTIIIILLLTITAAYGQSVDEMIRLNEEAKKLYNQANFHGAAQKWQQGLKIAKKMNDQQGIAIFTGNLGLVYHNLGDYPKALSYYERALAIRRAIGDKKGEGAKDNFADKHLQYSHENLKITDMKGRHYSLW